MSITSLYRRSVGGLDRRVRLSLGVPLVAVGLLVAGGVRGEPLGVLVTLVGFVSLLTGIIARCPLYVPFGISTARGHGSGGRASDRQEAGKPSCKGSELVGS